GDAGAVERGQLDAMLGGHTANEGRRLGAEALFERVAVRVRGNGRAGGDWVRGGGGLRGRFFAGGAPRATAHRRALRRRRRSRRSTRRRLRSSNPGRDV